MHWRRRLSENQCGVSACDAAACVGKTGAGGQGGRIINMDHRTRRLSGEGETPCLLLRNVPIIIS